MSAEEAEESAKEIETALRQGAILAGKMKGEVSREIQELLTPKVDWKEALRDFIKTTMQGKDQTTWRRLHKRYIGLDIIMPSTYSEQIGSIVVAIDTSGSIGQEELAQFLSEVKLICDEVTPESLDLLYWDTEVASHETYRGHELSTVTDVTQAKGGGGTSPECVPKYMHKNNMSAECLIMLTDGHISTQKDKDWNVISPMPIMWCVKGNSRFDSNSVQGKVVHVE
jgi:predicted metal-dependent peptidase